jgi:chemotaxis protein methyltransferase CheR
MRGAILNSAPVEAGHQIRPLTDAEFTLFQKFVYREAGISLSSAKKALVSGRLACRLRLLGLRSYRNYFNYVMEESDTERLHMLDCISTNETHFFREAAHFAFLQQHVFPSWLAQAASGGRARRIRVWSAGCSSGEEPYSIAMTLLAEPGFADWHIEIIASDISTRMLERAQAAIWPTAKAKDIPPRFLKLFMLKGVAVQAGNVKAGPEIRSVVSFHRMNLNDDACAIAGTFDLIFCRNVLIYFDTASKQRAVSRMVSRLEHDGYFFVGHAENLNTISNQVRSVAPTIYAHKPLLEEQSCR